MLNILREAAVLCSKFSCKTDAAIVVLEYIDQNFKILCVDCSIRVSQSFANCLVAKTNIWEKLSVFSILPGHNSVIVVNQMNFA